LAREVLARDNRFTIGDNYSNSEWGAGGMIESRTLDQGAYLK